MHTSISRLDRALVTAALLSLACGCAGGSADARSDAQPAPPDAPTSRTDARPGRTDAIALPGAELYPEGIAATADGTLYVGSLRAGDIYRVPPGESDATPIVDAAERGLVSAVGLLADETRGWLWACSSDPGVSPRTGEDPPAVKAFDLDTFEARGTYALPDGGFCNDLALDEAGNLYITDSFAPRILVLPAEGDELEVWLEDPAFAGEGFNLNGIVVAGNDLYTVKYNSGELFRIPIATDGSGGAPVTVTLDRELDLPDGLKLETAGVLLVVEGGGRLSRISLESGEVGAVTTVRDGLDDPTTATILAGDAWVLEGQLGHLFDPSTGDPDVPFQIVRVSLE